MQRLMKNCPPALRDLVWMLGCPKYQLCKHARGKCSFRDTNVDSSEEVSVANAWLALLQAPIRFELKVTRDGQYHVNVIPLPGKSPADVENWDASVVFVSKKSVIEQSSAKLDKLHADNVYCVTEENLAVLETLPVTAPNSPCGDE